MDIVNERDYEKEHESEPIVYRCGWCGNITDKKGVAYPFESKEHHYGRDILERFGEDFTKLTNGSCCPGGHN